MGHVLSAGGIGPAGVKVRSFLGLVNFTARFTPDLATVSASLRHLTKSLESFVWGLE